MEMDCFERVDALGEFDGLCFYKIYNVEPESEYEYLWEILNFKVTDEEYVSQFKNNSVGTLHQIVLFDEEGSISEQFEAYLGDSKEYVKNLLSIDQNGFIFKKCEKSQELIDFMIKKNFYVV